VYESSRVVVEEINDVVHQFLRQEHLGLVGGTGQPWKRGGSGPITCSGKIDHVYYLEQFPALIRLFTSTPRQTLGPYSVENGPSKCKQL
jgi:hypothetical protein